MARAAFFFVFSILVFNFLILMISAADSNNNGDNSGNGGNSGGNGNNNGGNSNNGGGNSGSNGNSNGGNGNNGGGNSNNNGNNNGGNTNNNGNSNGGNNNGNNNGGNNGGNGNNNNNGGGSQGNNNNNGNNGNNHNGGGNNNNNGNGNNNNNAAGGNNNNNNNNNGNNGNGNNNNNSGNNGNNNNNNNGNKGNNNNNNGNNGNNNNNNGSNNNNSNNGNNNNNNGNSSNVGKPIEYKFVGPVEIGVNWGNIASHPLPAKIIVQMLKDNNIKKAKLFDADAESVKALAGTGIEVMVAVPNGMLLDMATEYRNAKDWVKENVTEYVKDGSVKIKYVAVGNEPFLKSYNDSFTKDTYPALVHIQKAIDEAGFGKTIKATVPLNADVYESKTNLPSDGAFRSDIKGEIMKILKFLEDHDSPFVVNIYPFLSLYENPDFPSEFAFFEHGRSVQDGNLNYDNVLDANYDTLLWSLKKAGVPDLTIIIGEIGWPTDGHKAANVKSAQKFYDGLFKKLASKQGTPMRPKTEFDVYLFGFLDEDAKSIAPGKFERHWGIFRYDGQPKFPIDFSGRGQNKMPVGAKNVKYYDKKWCVFDKGVKDFSLVPPQFKKACDEGDCTAIAEGASCSWLDNLTQISYAFNMYFQINKQDDDACDFDGLALIEKKNASVGNCLFPIQIDSSAVSWMKMKSPTAIMATIVNAVILFTWLM